MADRPSHALIVRPAVVELPLWVVWRTAQVLAVVREVLNGYRVAYQEADRAQRRLAHHLAAALAALLLTVAVLAISVLA
jgi:hypothetical protein